MTMHVVVTVDEDSTEEQAVSAVWHMLNGCYPPGDEIYPCISMRQYEAKIRGQKIRQRRIRKKYLEDGRVNPNYKRD